MWIPCDYADRSMCVHGVRLALEIFRFFTQHPHAGCMYSTAHGQREKRGFVYL
jgi:hypothetical protein